MIDHGDGTYTINNKKTGENRRVKGDELSKYGLTAPRNEGAFEGAITKTGAYDIPVLGGVARALTHPLLKGAETVAEGGLSGLEILGDITGVKKITGPHQRTFMSPESYGNTTESDNFVGEPLVQSLKTGAGAASYAVPGGGFVGNTSMKGLAGAGGLASFGESGNTVGQTVGETALGTMLGPIAAKVPGLLGKTVSKTGEAIFEKAPAGLRKKIDLVEKQLINLENRKLTDMVGYENIAKAKSLGITPESMPEDVIRIVTPEMEFVGSQLSDVLGKEYANATISDVIEAFAKAQKQVVPGTKEVDFKDFKSRTKAFLQQNIMDESGGTGGSSIGQTLDFANDETPINLNIINKVKQRIGERFEEDPLYKQAYKNLQELIEERSGDAATVKALNAEYNTLRNIKAASDKQIKKGLSGNIENYDLKREKVKGNPLTDPLLATGASVGALGGSILGPFGAIPGGTFAMYRILANLLKNPDVARKLAGTLEAPKEAFDTPVGEVVGKVGQKTTQGIGKILEQAGVRLPSTF